MTARDEILNVIFSYAELMDSADFNGIGNLFEHGTITVEGEETTLTGKDEVTQAYVTSACVYPDTHSPKTKHVITNVIVNVDEANSSATSRSYFTVFQAVDGSLPLQPILCGRYRHSFVHKDGIWRFRNMHIIWDLIGDLSAHLVPN